ncbi:MAG: branched-chain amino acid ABC transporter permease [Pseudomonadota bacterium]
MQTVLQLLITALQIGSIYILFSLGLTLIFGVMKIVNFAHGQFFTLAALLVSALVPWLALQGWALLPAYLVAVVIAVGAAVSLGMLTYQFGFRFFQRDLSGSFILSTGLVLLLEGAFLHYFGGAVRTVPPFIAGNVTLLGVTLTSQRLLLALVAMTATAVLYWILMVTQFGKAMRAVSIDHEAAMLQGIPYKRVAFQGFALATLLGAVAGALLAPISVISPVLGADYLIKGFIAVIIGGLGSIPGAIIGSLFIALIESVGGFYFDPSIANLAIFTLVMLVLLVKPHGLLGKG